MGSRESRIGYVDYRQYGVDLELEKQRLGERVLRKNEHHVKRYPVSPQFVEEGQQNLESLTIAAYPYDFEEMQGLILIECVGKSALIRKQNGWLELYLQRAAHAIWYATTYARQNVQTSQLTNLHGFTESLTQLSDPKELFSQIAWETLHILAADVVVIYEYDRTTQEFITPPDIAGRLIYVEQMKSEVSSNNVPQKLIDYGVNTYSHDLATDPVFQKSDFSQREQIKSAAGILLKIQDEIVGVIFINYRREFYFSDSVRTLIETLASSIAIAIKNQRWLGNWVEALNDIDLKIITANQQEELLHQIVERAASATNANFAAIRLVNKVNQTLETCAIYPPSCPRTSGKYLSSFDEGITGWVAKNRMPQRVDDVSKDSRYRAFFPNVGKVFLVYLI
ncbi:hypothetical protein NIES3974_44780 [Calothrix sp. NIES-3974]|nr:hypothetical protein NIES3974_44780 [Calothrix sp. NIES-3974]